MRELICTGKTLWDFSVSGEAIVFDDNFPLDPKECDGKIIIVNTPSPDIIIYMNTCAAIVTETGGILCHAAVLALEIGCPIVVAVSSALELIQSGMHLTIYSSGHEGSIYEELL